MKQLKPIDFDRTRETVFSRIEAQELNEPEKTINYSSFTTPIKKMPKKEYSWSSTRVESRFREAREAHLNARQQFKEQKLAALRGIKSQTLKKNKDKASMNITTLFNSDKNSPFKELIVEDIYEEKDL